MNFTNITTKIFCAALIVTTSSEFLSAQSRIYIHSHNDYRQCVPFYQAYSQQVYSIEADIYATTDESTLLVAHDRKELPTALTLDELYINPIVTMYKRNHGKPWAKNDYSLQLMIDLKTPEHPTLDILVKKLQKYPEVFDPSVNPNAVKVLITGNTPKPEDFNKYPEFITFDGLINTDYTPEQLKRIGLISTPFFKLSSWNGKGAIISQEREKVEAVIKDVHDKGKAIRFWGCPDGMTAWNTFHSLSVDVINTDRPEACTDFFHHFESKNIQINDTQTMSNAIAQAKRLDKATRNFEGFTQNNAKITRSIDIYKPTFQNDGKEKKVKNVILLIGDGMGLSQICAAQTVNKTLSMLQLRQMGLVKTHSKDQYTTDSAGAGSSIATGKSTCNRHISTDENGNINKSLPEVLTPHKYACGVVTLGNIADATPAAFYGHTAERDNSEEITQWLLKGNLTLLNGSGMELITNRKDDPNFKAKLEKQYILSSDVTDMDTNGKKEVCLDEEMGKAATEENLPLLAEATKKAIQKLEKASNKGFFLMVEGAKIDYAGHANFLPGSVLETLSFDQAVAEALKFADKNGETLVIVTADHETGGLTLVDGNKETGHVVARYTTDDHTPTMVPLFAYGPYSNLFGGTYQNTDIFHKILKCLKIKSHQ